MSYLAIPVNMAYSVVDGMAAAFGLEPKVELSDHSIRYEYVRPDKDREAWDSNLYRRGNVFIGGYANPIKPRVHENPELENPNTVDVVEGNDEETDDDTDEADDGPHVNMISSARYRDYMRQDLVSQLLTPQEQWKLIAWGVLGLGILAFIQMIVTLYATGSF